MVSLWIVGRMMEHYFGPLLTLILYLASGVMGFLVSLLAHPTAVAVGASGAIFGLFGALGGFAYFHRERLGAHYRRFVREFGAILGLNLLVGLLIPAVDMSAHLGGLVFGAIGGYLAVQSRIAFGLFMLADALVAWGVVQFGVLPRMTILYLPA
jgi:rhomboid protease GluP